MHTVNDSPWLLHADINAAIRREVPIVSVISYAQECDRVGAHWLADLMRTVAHDMENSDPRKEW